MMKKKPSRGLQALVSGSLAIARFHTELEKTEQQLEHEIERDNRAPTTVIGKARKKGEKLIHTKAVLICVVTLNIIDCILVLGELILDMYYIKALLENSESTSHTFITEMKYQYPNELYNLNLTDINPFYDHILHSHVVWDNSSTLFSMYQSSARNMTNASSEVFHRIAKRATSGSQLSSMVGNQTRDYHFKHVDEHPIEEVLAHAFHKASISILCILALENLFKILSYGKSFLDRKLEMFDCMVVYCSLFVDVYFLKGISAFKIQDFVIILAFLVPWRVIRVVNSLVVSVIEHEHFRLKLLYKQKKDVSNELKKLKTDHKTLQQCLDVVKKMAMDEGISEQRIAQHLALLQYKNKKKGKGLGGENLKRNLPTFSTDVLLKFDSDFTKKQTKVDEDNNNTDEENNPVVSTEENNIV